MAQLATQPKRSYSVKAEKSYRKWYKETGQWCYGKQHALTVWRVAWRLGEQAEREKIRRICENEAKLAWDRWEKQADQLDQGKALQAEHLANALRKRNIPLDEHQGS
jgi:hypothetical protein